MFSLQYHTSLIKITSKWTGFCTITKKTLLDEQQGKNEVDRENRCSQTWRCGPVHCIWEIIWTLMSSLCQMVSGNRGLPMGSAGENPVKGLGWPWKDLGLWPADAEEGCGGTSSDRCIRKETPAARGKVDGRWPCAHSTAIPAAASYLSGSGQRRDISDVDNKESANLRTNIIQFGFSVQCVTCMVTGIVQNFSLLFKENRTWQIFRVH